MPTPAVTLKIRRFRRRFGIAAPRVTVRSHVSWQWYAGALVALVLCVAAAVWLVAQRGEKAGLSQEIGVLKEKLEAAEEELQVLRGAVGTEQSGMQMERTVRQQLLSRVKGLEAENASLKEEIAFFERLVPPVGVESAVRIERLQVSREVAADSYRYRLLIGFVPSKQVKEFKGKLQIVVSYALAGKDQALTLPEPGQGIAEYGVDVLHFQRKEGAFKLPQGAQVKGVEARLFQGDTLRAKRVATL
ncbi:MAG TPA: hypothetical protein PKD04_00500 [Rhodocyclaceae bacterium]|jgi:hypothetical protein|nr:hypothetical protein [Betaproteobacteria bacterium]HMU99525.1 hypothetical protein [Rhodocyclaceae bacterium]HMV22262.1 hypothetical protein [Rhodocyclaceae bacterium]HNL21114.1 hypothetical protein [Rhodocyclaceae bacterium]HNM79922.1 hypothetical protein [Rhodocyclaceae bacterium]